MYGRKRGPDGDGGFNKRKTGGGEIVKMLCPEIMTGSVIGKGGEEIRALQEKSGANIDVSKNGQNFPGTNERVITIKADKDGMFEVITFVHDKMKDHAKVHDGRKSKLKLLIADTSAGRIIGKGGETVKRLRSDWSVDVRPSVRGETPEDLDERILHIDGEWDNVMGCVDEVLQLIVDDRQAIMQKDVDYSQWCDFEPSERSNDRGRGGRGGFDRGGRGGRGGFRGASRDRGSPYSRGGPPRGRGGPPRGRPYSAAPIDDYSADPYGEDPYGGPPARGGPPRSRYSHGGPPHADDYEYDEPSFDAPPPRGGYSRGGPPRGGPPRRGSYPPVPRAKSYDAGPVDDGYYGAPPVADRFSGYGKPQEEYHDSFDQYNRKNRW